MTGAPNQAVKRLPPDFFLDDPPPLSSTPITPSLYQNTRSYQHASSIVMDLGSCTLRAGYSNSSIPSLQLPPYVARMRDPETGIRTFLTGNDALVSSARSTARPAYEAGVPNNPALMERLLDGSLAGLGLADEEHIPQRFVLTEAPCQPNSARALVMEILFEAYEARSVCFGIDALFSYFYNRHQGMSYARKDAVILSCGYNNTHILPLVNGRLSPTRVKRINIGGMHMTNQFTRRLQLLHSDHSTVLTTSRMQHLKEKMCYVSQNYVQELTKIQSDVDYYNEVTKTVKIPTGESADKPALSPEEQERLRQTRVEQGKRLSEMMREKRRAKKDRESGTDDAVEDTKYTEEDVQDLYAAMKKLYELQRIEEMREIDEDKYYIAMLVRKFESTAALNDEIEKRQAELDVERRKLGEAKTVVAEEAWWKKIHEDELLSMSDSELSAPELKRKRHVRALRGAAEARGRAKRAKEAEKVEVEKKAAEIRKMREERPEEYIAQLRKEREDLAEKIKKREAAREAGSDRRSQAARERMRLLAQHAGNKPGVDEPGKGRGRARSKGKGRGGKGNGKGKGKSGKKGKDEEEDTFGWNDSDWDVYRSMKVGGNESDSEDNSSEERSRLQHVREEIMTMEPDETDPTLSCPEGVALLYEDNRYPDEFAVTVDRIRTPELIFQPTIAGVEQCGIIEALRMSVGNSASLVKQVFLTGGVANTVGFRERICGELRSCFPSDWGDEIVRGVCVAQDPMLDAWRGAALFAEQGGEAFDNACITKAEFEEMGNGYLKEHAFSNVFFPTPILSAADLELKKKMQKQASKRGRPRGLFG